MNDEKTTIRVLADYECYPTWVMQPDGSLENTSPESLPISRDLADSLMDWADEYDAILNRDDPASSDFATPEDERRFTDRGREMAERLSREIGSSGKVVYFDSIQKKDIPIG